MSIGALISQLLTGGLATHRLASDQRLGLNLRRRIRGRRGLTPTSHTLVRGRVDVCRGLGRSRRPWNRWDLVEYRLRRLGIDSLSPYERNAMFVS